MVYNNNIKNIGYHLIVCCEHGQYTLKYTLSTRSKWVSGIYELAL